MVGAKELGVGEVRTISEERKFLQPKTTEECIKNIRAWLWLRRGQKPDDWLWSKAVEMQMYQDKHVGIPHSKAIPKHEGMQKGYVTRYVPIAHPLLPAITSTGRICESKDAWMDNTMTTSSSHAETCGRPGIYTIASLDECDSHCVATDILGDGNPAREIIENPDVCHDKGTNSIVEISENLLIGDYRMEDWPEIAGTDGISSGRIMEETPGKPLQGIGVGRHPELMDLTAPGAYATPESN
jgi:hypothetical protein